MPQPFSDLIPVTGPLADLTLRVHWEGLRPKCDRLPRPVRLILHGADIALRDGELTIDQGDLILTASCGGTQELTDFVNLSSCSNEPATICLEDDSMISAAHANFTNMGSVRRSNGALCDGVQFEFIAWEWLPRDPRELVFVAHLAGMTKPPGENLALFGKKKETMSRGHFRAEGCFTWHILKGERECYALAQSGATIPSSKKLCDDLFAMEFVGGESLNVDVAWGLDSAGNVVGALAPGCSRRGFDGRRSPVPRGRDTPECWAAPFFRLVVAGLVADQRELAIAITGYSDAMSGHVHSRYLLAQVALEASCRAASKKFNVPPLVKSVKDWTDWVTKHEDEIGAFAANEDDRRTLLNKFRNNVYQRPTGGCVLNAFRLWGVELPSDLEKEISKRNSSAHGFLMCEETPECFEDAEDRIDKIQMLLAAAIAKQVGYVGPIVGWERDCRGNLKVPEFWKHTAIPEASVRYVCQR